jgi:phosphatidylinositol-3-phosphatase
VRKIVFLLTALSLAANTPTGGAPERSISATSVGARAPRKLVIIFMENHTASDVIGNRNMPYLNAFARRGVRFTRYTEGDPRGPSLPDYLQIAAGSSCGKTSDEVSAGDPTISSHCPTTVWNQLQHHHVSWGVYMDGMPSPCYAGATYDNTRVGTPYALKHNPATPFGSIYGDRALCRSHVLPYTSFRPAHMPKVTFIAPGICNDQHGMSSTAYPRCLDGSAALEKRGDDWLKARVPKMLAAGATVFITYDESGTLYAAEVGPGIPSGRTDRHRYSHYSVLAAIERAYDLRRLGGARRATPLPL